MRAEPSTSRSKWGRAVGLSVLSHGLLVVVILFWARSVVTATAPAVTVDAPAIPTLVDLAPLDAFFPVPSETPPQPSPPVPADASPNSAWADKDNAPDRTTAPRIAPGIDRRRPSPDRGNGQGRNVEVAHRHDDSTLRERVTNGADHYQPPRVQMGARASVASPQAVRREHETGTADAPKTIAEIRPARGTTFGQVEADAPPSAVPSFAAEQAGVSSPLASGDAVANHAIARAEGPLDVDRGAPSLDAEVRGRRADTESARTASAENNPGITDLSRVSVIGASLDGKGRSPRPGAIQRPTSGSAPAVYGAREATTPGEDVQEATRQAHHWRYVQELERRIRSRLVWPKVLALRLEQGETIVKVAISGDGRVGRDVRIAKSSGFQEFDEAALDAIRRAAPFPPLPPPLAPGPRIFSLRFPFENPLIR